MLPRRAERCRGCLAIAAMELAVDGGVGLYWRLRSGLRRINQETYTSRVNVTASITRDGVSKPDFSMTQLTLVVSQMCNGYRQDRCAAPSCWTVHTSRLD